MATEVRETPTVVVERESRGMGVAGVLIAIAVLAAVVIGGFYLVTKSQNDTIRTNAVSGAASSIAGSAKDAAQSVGSAADRVAPAPTSE